MPSRSFCREHLAAGARGVKDAAFLLCFAGPTPITSFSPPLPCHPSLASMQLLACSTDTPEVHLAWIKTGRKRGGLGYMQARGWKGGQLLYAAARRLGCVLYTQCSGRTYAAVHVWRPGLHAGWLLCARVCSLGATPTNTQVHHPITHPPPPTLQIPILADVTKAVSARYGVLKRDAGVALRGLYLINPEASRRGWMEGSLELGLAGWAGGSSKSWMWTAG